MTDQTVRDGEDLAKELKRIRDKFLYPTPDKDHTDYAIITRCIAALSQAEARAKAAEEGLREIERAMPVRLWSQYPRSFRGGFDSAMTWAANIARTTLASMKEANHD